MEFIVYVGISFMVLSGFGVALYLKEDKKDGCGCSGSSACSTKSSCKSTDVG